MHNHLFVQPVDGLRYLAGTLFCDRNLGQENFDAAEKAAREVFVRLPMNYGITAGKCALALPDRAGVTGNHDGTGDG